ncbi:MAG TPA: DHHA1 domain-containing protein [Blastocatellia bacterium]|nr:DHHA1 domain-containing protein [Blastocatellia bacterium]
MQPTEKLYFTDSDLLDFAATVIAVQAAGQADDVILDRTAFYPTGGGQPNDTGRLDEARVLDVFEDDAGMIHHLVEPQGIMAIGQTVQGRIDRARRLDHLQQHSGQHILSQAFVQACGAETRSFHLGARASTIDIELASPTDDHMRAAEEIANAVIFEDRAMRVHLVNEAEARQLPLRKEAAVEGTIRVIEITDFDWSPCGGTHAKRTGQVGLIAIKGYERAKKMTRVEFVCGHRALNEYRAVSKTALAVAQLFSAERDTTPELVSRALQETRSLKKRLRELLEITAGVEASEMLAAATSVGNFKLVRAAFDDRDLDEVRLLASKITQSEAAVALLGTREAGAARLVFARSASLDQNMGQLLAEACQLLGGRGGGRPELAQGGGPNADNLEAAISLAAEKLLA